MKTREELAAYIKEIRPLYEEAAKKARAYQDSLAKPPGSLGKLEDISVKLSGITGKLAVHTDRSRIIVLCSDNGVTEEGISSAPVTVTSAQAMNMTRHLTGMSALAFAFGCETDIVDVGIMTEYDKTGIVDRNIRKGTRNLLKEAAMTEEEAIRAIGVGIERAEKAAQDGIEVLGVGEMGIGNTTTSSACLAALTGLSVTEVTGRGGGLTDAAFLHKKQVIEDALAMHKPDREDPLDVLQKVGGYDIAAMCGVFLGAAKTRIPVVIDGFISIVAALFAQRFCGFARDFMFPSHASYEVGYRAAAKELELDPYLLLDMRLGEGSGCPIAFQILRAACAVMNGMATFDGASINDDYLTEIRAGDSFTVK